MKSSFLVLGGVALTYCLLRKRIWEGPRESNKLK